LLASSFEIEILVKDNLVYVKILSMTDNKEGELVDPGLAILDLNEGSESVVTLGGKIIIDARDKMGVPGYRHGYTDRRELEKFNKVVHTVRMIIASSLFYKDISPQERINLVGLGVTKDLRDLGFNGVESVRVLGTIPPHWRPVNDIARRWVLPKNEWGQEKLLLKTGQDINPNIK